MKLLLSGYCTLHIFSEAKLEQVSNILRNDATHEVIHIIMIKELFLSLLLKYMYLKTYIYKTKETNGLNSQFILILRRAYDQNYNHELSSKPNRTFFSLSLLHLHNGHDP